MPQTGLPDNNLSSALCPPESPHQSANNNDVKPDNNFDDDYNEWEFGVGDLIIDLDADIEKSAEDKHKSSGQTAEADTPNMASSVEHSAIVEKGLKMKIKRKSIGMKSETKLEIVKSEASALATGSDAKTGSGVSREKPPCGGDKSPKGRGTGFHHRKDKVKGGEHLVGLGHSSKSAITSSKHSASSKAGVKPGSSVASTEVRGLAKLAQQAAVMKQNSTMKHSSSVDSLLQLNGDASAVQRANPVTGFPLKSSVAQAAPPSQKTSLPACVNIALEDISKRIKQEKNEASTASDGSSQSEPRRDACVGGSVSVGTSVDSDCFGPCDPGTSVNLEGIVWHETDTGMLVVNVTWRGKTYVGTLLDCTKHDWAPPRFCDSPTSDMEQRTPKGRGKRGRLSMNSGNDLSNFTETRSGGVHSKLRNGAKGRRGTGRDNPPASPAVSDITPLGNKRKNKDNELSEDAKVFKRSRSNSQSTTPTLFSQAPSTPEPPLSPQLIECPEPNCCKKYKHINGLRYHQSHAHRPNSTTKMDVDAESNDDSRAASSDESRSVTPVSKTIEQFSLFKKPVVGGVASPGTVSTTETASDTTAAEIGCVADVSAAASEEKPRLVTETVPVVTAPVHTAALPMPVVTTLLSVVTSHMATVSVQTSTDQFQPVVSMKTSATVTSVAMSRHTVSVPMAATLGSIAIAPTPVPSPAINTVSIDALPSVTNNSADEKKKRTEKPKPKPARGIGVSEWVNSAINTTSCVQSYSAPLSTPVVVGSNQPEQGKAVISDSSVGVANGTSAKFEKKQKPSKKKENESERSMTDTSKPKGDVLTSGKVMSPLHVNTDSNLGQTECALSPAYSDISDANDSATAMDDETSRETEKDATRVQERQLPAPQSLPNAHVYPQYFSQAQSFVLQRGSPSSQPPSRAAAPPEIKPSIPPDRPKDHLGSKNVESDGKRVRLDNSPTAERLQREHEFMMHQHMLQQHQQQQLPYSMAYAFPYQQYQYDPHQMHLLQTDPNYRKQYERFMNDQERIRSELMQQQMLSQQSQHGLAQQHNLQRSQQPIGSQGNVPPSHHPPTSLFRPVEHIKQEHREGSSRKPSPSLPPHAVLSSPSNVNVKKLPSEKERIEMALKEKQNENRLILKESIELKSQMGEGARKYDGYDHQAKPDESRRPAVISDARVQESKPSDLSYQSSRTSGSITKVSSTALSAPEKKKHESKPLPKLADDKPKMSPKVPNREFEHPHKSEKSLHDGRVPQIKQEPGSYPPGSVYAPMMHPQYMPAGPYGPIPFDPNQPRLYQGISPVMYPPGAYLAPQVPYQMPPEQRKLDKGLVSPSGEPPKALELLQHHASQYQQQQQQQLQQQHKIHELAVPQEKKSPAPTPTSRPSSTSEKSSEKGRDYRESPPAQRHVHTHHHTHVGVGYPIIPPGQFEPFVGPAGVIPVSAAGTVVHPYGGPLAPPKS